MKKTMIGILLATVAMYIWGALYWSSPFPYKIAGRVADDAAVGAVLKDAFPESGVYQIPGHYNERETIKSLMEAGPMATIHIRKEGMKPMELSYMIIGLAHILVFVILVSTLLKMTVRAFPEYRQRLLFTFVTGITATILTELTNPVWWGHPLPWYLVTGLYYILTWVIVGSILSAFIKPVRSA
jgi:hypothetical protein